MTLEVVLTETARRPLESAADWYAKQNPAVAATWFNGLIQRLNLLSENPEHLNCDRCYTDRANAAVTESCLSSANGKLLSIRFDMSQCGM
jgi:plasmid stabilization system protein ParE